MVRILFTGGGSAGHVTPNIALIEEARERGWHIDYAGSGSGIEARMIPALDVPFHNIASGKLRRYFSWQNFIDPFKVVWGALQSIALCLKIKPDVIFSKGGFVSVPVVFAGWVLGKPVLCHESDVTPGLANKLAYPFAEKICVNFEETLQYFPAGKALVTGTPVRNSLITADPVKGLGYLGLDGEKPLLLVFGGSLGARVINEQLRAVLDSLLEKFYVVHVVGEGGVLPALEKPGYVQREFISAEFGDVLAASSLVVSRAGANTLYELFSIRKPHLLIPLSRAASRGDQIENARNFEARGFSRVLEEHELNDSTFLAVLSEIEEDRESISQQIAEFEIHESVRLVFDELERALDKQAGQTEDRN